MLVGFEETPESSFEENYEQLVKKAKLENKARIKDPKLFGKKARFTNLHLDKFLLALLKDIIENHIIKNIEYEDIAEYIWNNYLALSDLRNYRGLKSAHLLVGEMADVIEQIGVSQNPKKMSKTKRRRLAKAFAGKYDNSSVIYGEAPRTDLTKRNEILVYISRIIPNQIMIEIEKVSQSKVSDACIQVCKAKYLELDIETKQCSKVFFGLLSIAFQERSFELDKERFPNLVEQQKPKPTRSEFDGFLVDFHTRLYDEDEINPVIAYLHSIPIRNNSELQTAAASIVNGISGGTEIAALNLLKEDRTHVNILDFLIGVQDRNGSLGIFSTKESLWSVIVNLLPQDHGFRTSERYIIRSVPGRSYFNEFTGTLYQYKLRGKQQKEFILFPETVLFRRIPYPGINSYIFKNEGVSKFTRGFPEDLIVAYPDSISDYNKYYSDLLEKVRSGIDWIKTQSRSITQYTARMMTRVLKHYVDYSHPSSDEFLEKLISSETMSRYDLDRILKKSVMPILKKRMFSDLEVQTYFERISAHFLDRYQWGELQTNQTFLELESIFGQNFTQIELFLTTHSKVLLSHLNPTSFSARIEMLILKYYQTFKNLTRVREFYEVYQKEYEQKMDRVRPQIPYIEYFDLPKVRANIALVFNENIFNYIELNEATRNQQMWHILITESLRKWKGHGEIPTKVVQGLVEFICVRNPDGKYGYDLAQVKDFTVSGELFITNWDDEYLKCIHHSESDYFKYTQGGITKYFETGIRAKILILALRKNECNSKLPFIKDSIRFGSKKSFSEKCMSAMMWSYLAPKGFEGSNLPIHEKMFEMLINNGMDFHIFQAAAKLVYKIYTGHYDDNSNYNKQQLESFAHWIAEKLKNVVLTIPIHEEKITDIFNSILSDLNRSNRCLLQLSFLLDYGKVTKRHFEILETIHYKDAAKFAKHFFENQEPTENSISIAAKELNEPSSPNLFDIVSKVTEDSGIDWSSFKETNKDNHLQFLQVLSHAKGEYFWKAVVDCWNDKNLLPLIFTAVVNSKIVERLKRFLQELKTRFGNDAIKTFVEILNTVDVQLVNLNSEEGGEKKSKLAKELFKKLKMSLKEPYTIKDSLKLNALQLSMILKEISTLTHGYYAFDNRYVKFDSYSDEFVKHLSVESLMYNGPSFGRVLGDFLPSSKGETINQMDYIQFFFDLLTNDSEIAAFFLDESYPLLDYISSLNNTQKGRRINSKENSSKGKNDLLPHERILSHNRDSNAEKDPFLLSKIAKDFETSKSKSLLEIHKLFTNQSKQKVNFFFAELSRFGLIEKILPLLASLHLNRTIIAEIGKSNSASTSKLLDKLLELIRGKDQASNGYMMMNLYKKVDYRPQFEGDKPESELSMNLLVPSLIRLGLLISIFSSHRQVPIDFFHQLEKFKGGPAYKFVYQGFLGSLTEINLISEMAGANKESAAQLLSLLTEKIQSDEDYNLNNKELEPVVGMSFLKLNGVIPPEVARNLLSDPHSKEILTEKLIQDCSSLLNHEGKSLQIYESKKKSQSGNLSRSLVEHLIGLKDNLRTLNDFVTLFPKYRGDLRIFMDYWLNQIKNRRFGKISPKEKEFPEAYVKYLEIKTDHLEFVKYGEDFERVDKKVYLEAEIREGDLVIDAIKRVTLNTREGVWEQYNIYETAHNSYFSHLELKIELEQLTKELDIFTKEHLLECQQKKESPFSVESLGKLKKADREKFSFNVESMSQGQNYYNLRTLREKYHQWRLEEALEKYEKEYSYGKQNIRRI